MYYLSLDIGTTGGKTLLFSQDMQLRQLYQQDYPTHHNSTDDEAEHDPQDWWAFAKHGVSRVLQAEGISGEAVAGIGLSCMTPVLLALDADSRCLTRAWLWYDRRAAKMLPAIERAVPPERMAALCGSTCKEVSFLCKLLHFKSAQPELYAKTAAFVQANGYLVYRMTGRITLDSSHGALLHLVEKESGRYCAELFDTFQISRAKFPPLIPAAAVAGTLTEAAAAELGLSAGTPVVSGGHDSALSAYAFGLDTPGKACLDIGNAANLVMAAPDAVVCPAADVYGYPEGGKWLFQIYSATCGAAFRWYRNTFGPRQPQTGVSDYDVLCAEASRSPAGANGLIFLPYFQGAQQCARLQASFRNMALHHTRADFVRAVLEGCAMSVRLNREQMEQAAGFPINTLYACGGGAQNPFWLQIFADVLGVPVTADNIQNAATTGAAMLAYKTVTGKRPTVAGRVQRIIQPLAENRAAYDAAYARFRAAMEQDMHV